MTNPLFEYSEEQRAILEQRVQQEEALLSPYATRHGQAIMEYPPKAAEDPTRPAFLRDVDRILNCAYYNRCTDKTQVFPFYRNDDLTRRSFHLQLVAQISVKLARALGLNTALTRAIALGHDLGHTPFGHGGEYILSDLYHERTGRYFNHNVHGVRLIRTVANVQLSLQAFNGILCHCGEKAFDRYEPEPCDTFEQLEAMMERCYQVPGASQELHPSTLEGCVVRICDMLAYLGKDRQDAVSVGAISEADYVLQDNVLGRNNADIIQNATANIIKNSLGKPYLAMDPEVFEAMVAIKDLNSAQIYSSAEAHHTLDTHIEHMMRKVYFRCLADLEAEDEESWIYRHHLNSWVMKYNRAYRYEQQPDDMVVDYIASMTDDYFIDLYNAMYPEEPRVKDEMYVPYFRPRTT